MKKILAMMVALFAFPFTAHAETTSELQRAPFPAVVTLLDFDTTDAKLGCQLSTTNPEEKIRLRWIPSETSVERSSLSDGKVQGRVKVSVTKLAETDGVAVYGYREANALVLFVPGKEMFATVTASGDRLFFPQNCGMGITLLFTKPLPEEYSSGCDSRVLGTHLPGFCGKLAKLAGNASPELGFAMTAGLGPDEKVRVLLKTHPVKPTP